MSIIEFKEPTLPAPVLKSIWRLVNQLKDLNQVANDYHNLFYSKEFYAQHLEAFQCLNELSRTLDDVLRRLSLLEAEKRVRT